MDVDGEGLGDGLRRQPQRLRQHRQRPVDVGAIEQRRQLVVERGQRGVDRDGHAVRLRPGRGRPGVRLAQALLHRVGERVVLEREVGEHRLAAHGEPRPGVGGERDPDAPVGAGQDDVGDARGERAPLAQGGEMVHALDGGERQLILVEQQRRQGDDRARHHDLVVEGEVPHRPARAALVAGHHLREMRARRGAAGGHERHEDRVEGLQPRAVEQMRNAAEQLAHAAQHLVARRGVRTRDAVRQLVHHIGGLPQHPASQAKDGKHARRE